MKAEAKVLVDVVEDGARGLAGRRALSFGKIVKELSSGGPPAPADSLHDNGLEVAAFIHAGAACVKVTIFVVFVITGGRGWVMDGLAKS